MNTYEINIERWDIDDPGIITVEADGFTIEGDGQVAVFWRDDGTGMKFRHTAFQGYSSVTQISEPQEAVKEEEVEENAES